MKIGNTRELILTPGREMKHPNCLLKKLRIVMNLTQRVVASGTGLNRATIHQAENGCEVTLSHAYRLAAYFGRRVDEIWPDEKGGVK